MLFKDISDQANTLFIVFNPVIHVGIATVAANRFRQKGSLFFSISGIRVVGLKKFAGVGGCQKNRGACGAINQ